MRKTIGKFLGVGAALALLLSTQPAAAQQCCQPVCDPCCNPCMDWCDMCGDFEVGAHALLFTPVACEYDYAIRSNNGIDNVYTVKCELDWGFRVFGQYNCDCTFYGLSYQWFESKSTDAVTDADGNLTTRAGLGDVESASGTIRLKYQNVDVRLGKYLHRSCGCNFFLFGNARWVDLEAKRSNRGTAPSTPLDITVVGEDNSTLRGGALGVGAGAEFDLWCDIGLFGEANLLGVIANRSTKQGDVFRFGGTNPLNFPAKYASQTCINPEVNFKIGLNYTYTCGCWTFVGELGYEVDYFWNAFAFANSPNQDSSTPDLTRHCEDVGFSGLFFGGRVLF